MQQEIRPISLSLPFRLGRVNCHLIETNTGYVLIDTGGRNKRTDLERELEGAGCRPGYLKLILLTHGDFDHTGNAAYLRKKFSTKIAMHRDDSEMVVRGNMLSNRKGPGILIRMMVPIVRIIFGFGKLERFEPDLYVEDGYDLSEYGLDAKVLRIPGHSKGSIGILTAGGNLFCGDLIINGDKSDQPRLNSIMDDSAVASASVERLKELDIQTVYPGHGRPFPMELFTGNR